MGGAGNGERRSSDGENSVRTRGPNEGTAILSIALILLFMSLEYEANRLWTTRSEV